LPVPLAWIFVLVIVVSASGVAGCQYLSAEPNTEVLATEMGEPSPLHEMPGGDYRVEWFGDCESLVAEWRAATPDGTESSEFPPMTLLRDVEPETWVRRRLPQGWGRLVVEADACTTPYRVVISLLRF
jgi:hypothetical protein